MYIHRGSANTTPIVMLPTIGKSKTNFMFSFTKILAWLANTREILLALICLDNVWFPLSLNTWIFPRFTSTRMSSKYTITKESMYGGRMSSITLINVASALGKSNGSTIQWYNCCWVWMWSLTYLPPSFKFGDSPILNLVLSIIYHVEYDKIDNTSLEETISSWW